MGKREREGREREREREVMLRCIKDISKQEKQATSTVALATPDLDSKP